MTVRDWLQANAPFFFELSQQERDAAQNFALLWTLFEAGVAAKRANKSSIERAVGHWCANDSITEQTFAAEIAYFRRRYFRDGEFTEEHDGLNLDEGSENVRVAINDALRAPDAPLSQSVVLAFLIVLRYRNNYFHGAKWDHGLRGQLANFTHANSILMKALDLHRVSPVPQSSPET